VKGLLAAIISTFAALGCVGYLAAGSGWSDDHSKRMRGRTSYYEDEDTFAEPVEKVHMRISSAEPGEAVFLMLDFEFSFRVGKEIDGDDARELIEKRLSRMRDALLVPISERSASELMTLSGKYRLKRLVRDQIQEAVFPRGLARVDNVLFRELLLQRTRND